MELLAVLAGAGGVTTSSALARWARAVPLSAQAEEAEDGEGAAATAAALAAAVASDDGGRRWGRWLPLLHGRPAAPDSDGDGETLLVAAGPRLLPALVTPAGCPSQPPALRLAAAELAGHLFSLLSTAAEAPGGRGGATRLRSFAQRGAAGPAAAAAWGRCVGAARAGVGAVLALLDDGRDEVRFAAADALRAAVPVVAPDTDASSSSSSSRSSGDGGSADGPAYAAVVARLLREAVKLDGHTRGDHGDGDGDPWPDAVDAVLRALAVLDASAFERHVRAALVTAGSDITPPATARLSELIDHATVLSSF